MIEYKMKFLALISTLTLFAMLCGCEDESRPFACFLADTRITTPNGVTAIQNLRVGDAIVSVDPQNRKALTAHIRAVGVEMADEYLIVTAERGQRVRVTPHHPFWVPAISDFREIGLLARGQVLASWNQRKLELNSILGLETVVGQAKVYHIEVDRAPHTFVANGFVVHNKPPMTRIDSIPVTVQPHSSGWVKIDDDFLGQGADTLLIGSPIWVVEVEAVPRVGWAFDHWEGTVSRTDTFVVDLLGGSDRWVRCVFKSLN